MVKYLLCIIIGIILYILLNRRNGFSVGGSTCQDLWTDTSTDDPSDHVCGGEHLENKAATRDPVSGNCCLNPIYVNMSTNDDINCNPSPNCEILLDDKGNPKFETNNIVKNGISDICYDTCRSDDEECKKYHTYIPCMQKCPLLEVRNDNSKNLENAGFMKIDKLIDIEMETSEQYFDMINAGEDQPNFKKNDFDKMYKGLRFQEYWLKQYLEKINNDLNIKKISNRIFYINGQIYIFTADQITVRDAHQFKDVSDLKIHRDCPLYEYVRENVKEGGQTLHYNYLHSDTQNFIPYEVLPDDPLSNYEEECKSIGIPVKGKTSKQIEALKRPNEEFIISQFSKKSDKRSQMIFEAMTDKEGYTGSDIIKEHFDKFSFINIWVLLYGSPNVRTLGFIDAIDDEKLELQNETTWQMIRDTTDPDNLTSAFNNMLGTNPIYPNVYNADTKENTDDTKPDIDVSKLYTYDMEAGDALVFKTDKVPHIGFPPVDRYGLRISGECRYELLKSPLVISKAYVLIPTDLSIYKEDKTVNIRLSGTGSVWSDLNIPVDLAIGDLRHWALENILKGTSNYPDDIETENVRLWLNDEIITHDKDEDTISSIGVTTGKHIIVSDTDTKPSPKGVKFFMDFGKVDSYPYINKEIEDIIYIYFEEQFKIFLEVYNKLALAGKLPLTIKLFEKFMDETPYDDYYYGQSRYDDYFEEKDTTIEHFFKVTLAEV